FDDHVLIEWESFAEQPGILYEVERSSDGQHFRSIGQISETGQERYELLDRSPVMGENFYRILAIDPTGYFDFSKVVSTRFPGRAPIEVFPNPVFDEIQIYFQEIEDEAVIRIYNLQGQVVRREVFADDREEIVKRMFVPTLSPGVYLYRIVSGDVVAEGKFIKQR
ncbi:MAG: T9SS type A sorting domain-containing protein, partial [Bacteroidota bacterium]